MDGRAANGCQTFSFFFLWIYILSMGAYNGDAGELNSFVNTVAHGLTTTTIFGTNFHHVVMSLLGRLFAVEDMHGYH